MREEAEHLAFWGLEEEPANEFKIVSVIKQFLNMTTIITFYERFHLDLGFLFVCHFCQTGDCHS